MRYLNFLLALLCALIISGCIPSLHGIVTDENRMVDDAILGVWSQLEEQSPTMELKTPSHQSPETEKGLGQDPDHFANEAGLISWTFERAGRIQFDHPEKDRHVQLSVGVPSMCPPGMGVSEFSSLPYYILTHRERSHSDTVTTRLCVHLTEIGGLRYMDFKPYPPKSKELQGRFASNYLFAHTFAQYRMDANGLMIYPIDTEYVEKLIRQKRVRLKHERIGDDEIVLTASTIELRAFLEKYGDDPALFSEAELLRGYGG